MSDDLNAKKYYDESYFEVQKAVGIANVTEISHIFSPHIELKDCVLDFGCGGGFLLNALNCAEKHGFDVNDEALKQVKNFGITAHNSFETIPEGKFDIIISNSCLEHVTNPFEVLQLLRSKLKDEGTLFFRVPHETLGYPYKEGDWNYHLFTWSPMAIGNLVNAAGYKNITVGIEKGMRPPLYRFYRGIPFINTVAAKLYRLLRLLLEELTLKRVGMDGYAIVKANK
jgi:SAM-dependent methyltransferase